LSHGDTVQLLSSFGQNGDTSPLSPNHKSCEMRHLVTDRSRRVFLDTHSIRCSQGSYVRTSFRSICGFNRILRFVHLFERVFLSRQPCECFFGLSTRLNNVNSSPGCIDSTGLHCEIYWDLKHSCRGHLSLN
jgi:hypothetical protein